MEPFEENRIDFLVPQFLEHGLTTEEQKELKALLQMPEMHAYFKTSYLLWNIGIEKREDTDADRVWQKIWTELGETHPPVRSVDPEIKRPGIRRWGRIIRGVAAAACFVLGMATYHALVDSPNLLTRKSGQQEFSKKSATAAVNRITTPLGSKSVIELSDGSTITLNAGSKIEYTSDYGVKNRNIELIGEGYFKVAKNHPVPFIVKAQNTVIKALGTEFNVKAYVEENLVQTTLVEGSVSINPNLQIKDKTKDIVLKPNQTVTIFNGNSHQADNPRNKSKKTFVAAENKGITLMIKDAKVSMETVNPVLYVSWKDRRWVIEGEEIESLTKKLERRFGVDFILAGPELREYKFSGILEDETLEQTMEILKAATPINYKIDKKVVLLNIDQKQKKAFEKSMTTK